MPRRSNDSTTDRRSNRRRKASTRTHGLGSVVLFWPFFLVTKITSSLPYLLRLPVRVGGWLSVMALYVIIPASLFYYARARSFDIGKVSEMPERSIVFDRRGEELGRIHGEKRDIIKTSEVATEFLQAILAREDERFYNHGGVDWIGFGRATLRNVKDRGMTQGASTLTMQLARNSYDLHAKLLSFSNLLQELDRKFLEIAVSYRIESNYTKDEILQHYVNRIFWGHTIRGIEEASRTYFEKQARDLSLSESALLAGIVRGPNAFSPFKDIADARRERDATLERMVIAESITREEADAAKTDEITVRPEWRRTFHDSWAMDAVRRELERNPFLVDENVEFGGLQITTTIDNLIQKKAEEELDKHLRSFERGSGYRHQTRAEWKDLPEPKPRPAYLQGSVVVIENLTGSIIATVGGRDADESKYNRASQAKRQIGSTFKPFVYLAAFDEGLHPQTMVSDDRLRPGEVKGAGRWSPSNSDGKFLGMQPTAIGLIRSRNTMTVRIGDFAGIEKVSQVAHAVGFKAPMKRDPAAFLGTIDASPEEVASAYTIFPNLGVRYPPRLITEIRDRNGNVLFKNDLIPYTATSDGPAWQTSQILHEVMERGTGASVKRLGFNKSCAGKTGTTNDYKDAWFVGYTSSLTCAVWVGLDQPAKIFDRAYGSKMALPVWTEVMKTADRLGYQAEGLQSQLSFADVRLCRDSGKLATEACERAETAFTASLPKSEVPPPTEVCTTHTINTVTAGNRPPKATPIDAATINQPAPPPVAAPVRQAPSERAPRAQPAPAEAPVPRALPVDEPVPRAIPIR